MSEPARDYSHMVADARKRIAEADELLPNFDEQYAHLHEWPEPNIQLGEE